MKNVLKTKQLIFIKENVSNIDKRILNFFFSFLLKKKFQNENKNMKKLFAKLKRHDELNCP